jgi:alkanesulfonate monooxygenase SsuD/methylene tetrahydromethanopterin reductase-like flavin-dependent oxidoreductase (luciferase family)
MVGRGSFIESFPLFGYDLDDYDTLFDEKLRLLLALRDNDRLTWPGGRFTPKVDARGVYPRPVQAPLPVWIAVGGTPQSVVRAGTLGLPLALAIIGGEPARFAPFFELYRRAAREAGHDPKTLATSINVHGFVAETSQQAADIFYPAESEVMNRIGRERGWGPTSRAQFDLARGPAGASFTGSPAEVVDKILANHAIFGFDRFMLQMAVGVIEHRELLRAIELYGTRVAPEVRKALA